jgi:DNA replication protein DnaC
MDPDEPRDLYGLNPHMAPQISAQAPCPFGLCDGSGFVLREEDDAAMACRCREQRVARARTRKLASQIPKKFRDVAFDRHPVNKMPPMLVREVSKFCRRIDEHLDDGDSIGFFGGPGNGKTTLAMLVSIEAARRNRTVAIYTGPELLTAIRRTYDDNSYSSLMESLVAVDLLHIEDLAVARTNDWVLEQLYTVVNSRYQDERSVMFTADVTEPGDLAEHVGARTFSRLAEMCGERLIPMFADDQRTKAVPRVESG